MRHLAFAAAILCALTAYKVFDAFVAVRSLQVTEPVSSARIQLPTLRLRPADSLPISNAIEVDPFREDRTPPAARYRIATSSLDSAGTVVEEAPRVTLLGTVVAADGGSFALCQSGDDAPRLVRLGQSIGGLLLQRVGQAQATFTMADGRLTTLTVAKIGPDGQAGPP